MKSIKLLLISLLFVVPLLAHADDGYIAWKKQVLAEISTAPIDEAGTTTFAYRDYSQPVRDLADKRLAEVEKYITDHVNDSTLLYIRGWLTRKKLYFYIYDSQQAGIVDLSTDNKAEGLQEKYQSYYRKALDLDDAPDAPAHLDHYMLTAMGTDVLAAPDIKEKAMKKKIELTQKGNALHPNQEWGSYEFLLGTYAEQRDYDNYLKTVNEMMARFPNSSRMNELVEYKRQAEAAIEKRDREAASVTDQHDVYAAPDPKVIVNGLSVVKKVEQPKAPAAEKSGLNLWLLFGGGIVLLGLIVFLMRRKKV